MLWFASDCGELVQVCFSIIARPYHYNLYLRMEMKNKVYKILVYRYQGNLECRSILLISWGKSCKGNDFAKSCVLPHEETRFLTQGKRCLLKRPLFYTNWRKVVPVWTSWDWKSSYGFTWNQKRSHTLTKWNGTLTWKHPCFHLQIEEIKLCYLQVCVVVCKNKTSKVGWQKGSAPLGITRIQL